MAVPTYDRFIEPVLRYLAAHPEGAKARDAHEAAANALGISEADRAEVLPSGRETVYKNRAGWAHDRLKRAGLSTSPQRGFWKLSEAGLRFAREHSDALSDDELGRLVADFLEVRLRDNPAQSASSAQVATAASIASPDDRLDQALGELRATVARELLEALAAGSPKFFESVVLDLLHAMGYGASRSDLQRVGGSGDGGIDGIISLDRLGFEKVYVQAKRWQSSVGRPEIQGFYGALAGQRANKGVFITTSTFTAQALEFARSVERVVLVDGARLADLMIEHGVGVSHRVLQVPKLDSDYFEV
jgi:restriction system protein